MAEEIKNIKESFKKDLEKAENKDSLENLKVKYLGRKSKISQLFSNIPNLAKQERGHWGKELNILKNKISSAIKEKLSKEVQKEEKIDLTYPAKYPQKGSIHILSSVTKEICLIFKELGFNVIEGNEVEDEWHNFSALNIPLDHPSRDAFDTFYLDLDKKDKKSGSWLLRSHTSPSQIRIMQQVDPPLAVISPGRVYRPDVVDATHSFMFYQIEGFVVGQDISFSHLKGVLLYFARQFFSQEVQLRFRPHFFPFTEPSAEVDVSCVICSQKNKQKNKERCPVCKGKGWLEILGCGMIHPNVLEACNIDSKKYQGFAFGMGVDRIIMQKYQINDIRLFYENDKNFLKQFPL
ncbi:MAG: phenylalanine--tRNA ligase subunit alpha [Candidatus Omnitrophica bacterium]|nr:phenylalanine--tRNA ligase subunit alpha [Candidatus Omnitrophota bacterium]MCF7893670.1 phenylalanine--tRNA ligase subunit alpha [Candidatus Omnitrophota bacterium]